MKIANKLLCIALFPAVIIWGVGLSATSTCQSSLRESIRYASADQAREVMNELDHAMKTRIAQWQEISQTPLVQETLAQSNREFAALSDANQRIDEIDSAWRDQGPDSLSEEMKSLQGNPLAADLRNRLNEFGKGSEVAVYGEVFITNRFGANVAQTNRTSDYRQDDEEWWKLAARDGVHCCDVEFDESSGIYSTSICLRVNDNEGRFLGVFKAVLNLQEAVGIVKRWGDQRGRDASRVALFTADQRIIHSSFASSRMLESGALYFVNSPAASESSWTIEHIDPTTGKELLSTFARSDGYAGFKGFGWILLVEFPADKIFAPVYRLRNNIVGIATVATLLSTFFGGWFAISLSRRIQKLANATKEIGRGNLRAHVTLSGRDELTSLARNLNQMANGLCEANGSLTEKTDAILATNIELRNEINQRKRVEAERQELNDQLIESSRQAGKAEVATGVLHNVGNALNSVNVSTQLMRDALAANQIKTLTKAAVVLGDHADDLGTFLTLDPCGKHFPRLLKQLSVSLEKENASMILEVNSIAEDVEHIAQIINMQQTYAKRCGVNESVGILSLIDESIKLNRALVVQSGAELVTNFKYAPTLLVEKHKVLQILVNLIGNACQAVQQSTTRKIFLSTSCEMGRVCVEVRDEGGGIASENLTRIFQHGFTTKSNGHGFGLHSSALAAEELNGGISVFSNGMGQGATFKLFLPLSEVVECTN